MIFDAIMEFFLTPILKILQALPQFEFELPTDIYGGFAGFAECLGFVLPMPLILTVLGMKISFYTFKIGMALIVRIKSFVPFWGA